MNGNAGSAPGRSGFYRFMFWLSAAVAAYHLVNFFYMGAKASGFALEWGLWRSLFLAGMCACVALYFRGRARNAPR